MGDDGFSPAQVRIGEINMAEVNRTPVNEKTPNRAFSSTPSKAKTPLRPLRLSPCPQLLSPNNDEEERARVRAARANAQRRPLVLEIDVAAGGTPNSTPETDNILSHDALKNLLQNCLKLSAANKINQGNTWDLKLIDHLSDLVKDDSDDEGQTNFQKASCTLETGVKIYSYRVDSVHSEAYKLMGGLSRNASEDTGKEARSTAHNEQENEFQPESILKATGPKKSTGTTLESSLEALNVKKLDVAFTVDPLFHQTSAQFDEGGARGLLLNNLSVYRGCEIVFDSHEVPEKIMKAQIAASADRTATIDLSPLRESLEQMIAVLETETEITPSLNEILKLIDDPLRAAAEADRSGGQRSNGATEDTFAFSGEFDGPYDGGAPVDDPGEVYDHIDDSLEEPSLNGGFGSFSPQTEGWDNGDNGVDSEDRENELSNDGEIDGGGGDTWIQDPLGWLMVGDGLLGKSNDWAGPGHWKYAKPKCNVQPDPTEGDKKPKSKRKKKEPFVIDFENLPEIDRSSMLAPVKHTRMPQTSASAASILLPEDYYSETSSLLKFFLRPSVVCGRGKKARLGKANHVQEDTETFFSEARWDDDGDDDTGGWGNWEASGDPDSFDLVAQPRKVQKISVNYVKHPKQVDVRVLKQVLWKQLQEVTAKQEDEADEEIQEGGLSFHNILKHIPEDCLAAAPEDISIHLCFICLLHLANEQNLLLQSCPSMDDLRIFNVNGDG
ncbi:hypothetical protein R1flu_020888 [Riccia fluitans]|uniref:Condensin complex subunit 2 n=1 Tax=Riccia fluitans TaxID=41844 RepID=A0ABD1ZPA8_9MARC